MTEDLNLIEIQKKITNDFAYKIKEYEDSGVYAYLTSVIKLLEVQGKDPAEYALVRVETPMELKNDSVRVTSQYRIVLIDDLENIPTYEG